MSWESVPEVHDHKINNKKNLFKLYTQNWDTVLIKDKKYNHSESISWTDIFSSSKILLKTLQIKKTYWL